MTERSGSNKKLFCSHCFFVWLVACFLGFQFSLTHLLFFFKHNNNNNRKTTTTNNNDDDHTEGGILDVDNLLTVP